jgi:predicted HicB family RNase H-like nuclease
MTEPTDHGDLPDGTPITDEMLDEWSAEAEAGYDVDGVRRRRRIGRPPLRSGASTVESVRLDPELKRDLLLRAAEDGVSVSELIRTALRAYVRAS